MAWVTIFMQAFSNTSSDFHMEKTDSLVLVSSGVLVIVGGQITHL